jgi:hypothetical protein
MVNLTPEQIEELLQLIATGLKAHVQTGNATSHADLILAWMKNNAPAYLD